MVTEQAAPGTIDGSQDGVVSELVCFLHVRPGHAEDLRREVRQFGASPGPKGMVGVAEKIGVRTLRGTLFEAALSESAGSTALWRSVPSWFVFGDLDHHIPPARTTSWLSARRRSAWSKCPADRTSLGCRIPTGHRDDLGRVSGALIAFSLTSPRRRSARPWVSHHRPSSNRIRLPHSPREAPP
jgi:hypothetical protein